MRAINRTRRAAVGVAAVTVATNTRLHAAARTAVESIRRPTRTRHPDCPKDGTTQSRTGMTGLPVGRQADAERRPGVSATKFARAFVYLALVTAHTGRPGNGSHQPPQTVAYPDLKLTPPSLCLLAAMARNTRFLSAAYTLLHLPLIEISKKSFPHSFLWRSIRTRHGVG